MTNIRRRHPWLGLLGVLATLVSAACHEAQEKQPEFGPMPVNVHALAEALVADQDEYLASLTSRHSITLYAQVTGYIREIGAKPGDEVKAGALLVQIDPAQQASTLRSLQASLETRKANLAFAIQNDESSKGLVKSGLLSELDYDLRHSQRASAESDVKTAEAQLEAQGDLLRYYRITAPTSGTVGDVPVKVGDYVTPQTRLTSVDQDSLIEAYVYVPVSRVQSIAQDTKVALVTDDGKVVCEVKPSFISPQVNVDSQSVLVKAICPNDGALRAAQVLKARLIWSRQKRLTVPVSVVTRQAGQYFVYVAENAQAPGGGLVARQTPIKVGTIDGNAFVVTAGLSPGQEVVTSMIQKLHDGAPISRAPEPPPGPSSASAAGAPSGRGI